MKRLVVLCLIGMLFSGTGCFTPSRGRVTVIGWDSRKAEELNASKYMEGLVYGSAQKEDVGETKTETTQAKSFSWIVFMQQLFGFKGSVKFFEVEWDTLNATSGGKDLTKPVLTARPVVVGKEKTK